MTKELSKKIITTSKSKNLYFKWHSRENFLAYESVKKCIFEKESTSSPGEKMGWGQGWKVTSKKEVNHFGMQWNPFALIEEG